VLSAPYLQRINPNDPVTMKSAKPLNIICAGECMVELRQAPLSLNGEADTGTALYASSFAGDVINFSVYLKRLSGNSSCVYFLSATGNDVPSKEMRAFFSDEDIGSELVAISEEKTVGLYMIHTDALGERTFSYWRSDSAARTMFELADRALLTKIADRADYLYFSGITLAILDPPGREQLFDLVEQCRRKRKTIIFDPNYRADLWQSRDQAATQIERAYQCCNVLLSSSEDEQLLWGVANTESALDRLTRYGIDEIVLTNGPDEILGYDHGRPFRVQPAEADKVVDTTSAGDSFNAGYIAARHAGLASEEAVAKASSLASLVIGFSGAIIPKSSMLKRASQVSPS
jgi:2-dehydro-3-deoxygluconokinase